MDEKTPQAIAAELAAEDEEMTDEEIEAVKQALSPDKPEAPKKAVPKAEADEEDDAEEAEVEGEEAEGQEKPGEKAPGDAVDGDKPAKLVIPPELQPEIDRIVRDRLGRDRKATSVAKLEQIYGKPLELILPELEQQQKAQFEQKVRTFAESNGVTEEFAREILTMRQDQERILHQSATATRQATIAQQKADLRSQPFFKELEADVDDLLAGDSSLDFRTAFIYLRGERLPELLQQQEKRVEQRVIGDVRNRQKAQVKTGATSGDSPSAVTPRTRQLAKLFGVPVEELAKREKAKGGK